MQSAAKQAGSALAALARRQLSTSAPPSSAAAAAGIASQVINVASIQKRKKEGRWPWQEETWDVVNLGNEAGDDHGQG